MTRYRMTWLGALLFCGVAGAATPPGNAQWIWSKDVNAGKRWFRREVRAFEPSTGIVWIASSGPFTLYVNGTEVGSGKAGKAYRYSLNGIVERGVNSVAVATNSTGSGPAGILVNGEVRSQGGSSIPFDSGKDWKVNGNPPAGDAWTKPLFAESGWQPVKTLGLHKDSPWKSLAIGGSMYDRFQMADGFDIEQIAPPSVTGSLTSLAWGNRGRLLVTREREPIYSLVDEKGTGKYTKAIAYSQDVKNCQGICQVGDDLYACGDGPQGTGLYRMPDRNHDDKADKVELIHKYKGGMGDHGPHTVVQGPDGWLYNIVGNHCWIQAKPQPNSPILKYEEGDLLRPRYEDPNGHAAGIKAPGGTIWRFTPDGKQWFLHTMGFRNAYDMCFNSQGDLFSFDSDMEWEVGMPFYKPIRMTHCIAGADFGWRSNSAKWPEYYFDSLPALVDVGRGSPTGVVVYEHNHLPAKYRGAILASDWSMGRLIAVFPKRQGATYSATFETIASGNPLNIVDIEVDRDGSLVFATGGRGTEGGVYRIKWTGKTDSKVGSKPSMKTIDDALAMPQIQAQWAKEACAAIKAKSPKEWAPKLEQAIKTGTPQQKIRALTLMNWFGPKPTEAMLLAATEDGDSSVRAFALMCLGKSEGDALKAAAGRWLENLDPVTQRAACEAIVRLGLPVSGSRIVQLLGDNDRWVRYAARLVLERIPRSEWGDIRTSNAFASSLLAMHRMGEKVRPSIALREAVRLVGAPNVPKQTQLDFLRVLQLQLIDDDKNEDDQARISQALVAKMPVGDDRIDRELARIVAYCNPPTTIRKLLDVAAKATSQASQIHYILCLSYVKDGWDSVSVRRVMDWYEKTRNWEGGHSFAQHLEAIVGNCVLHFPRGELKSLILEWRQRPFAARVLLGKVTPEMVDGYDELLGKVTTEVAAMSNGGEKEEFTNMILEALGRSSAEKAQAMLRKFFDEQPDRRDQLARLLAKHPSPASRAFYLRAIQSGDNNTIQECIKALRSDRSFKAKPDEIRAIVLAGLKLGRSGGMNAAALLQKLTGSKHGVDRDASQALAHYQKWYREKFPNEPAAELPQETQSAGYNVAQLTAMLDGDEGRKGDVQRGKAIFTKANCVKCHRFGSEGQGVGPDLTSVRRRFNKKEIVESVIFPSMVISDQYKGVTVSVNDGRVYTGTPISPPGSPKLTLVLSDATKVEIPRSDIESSRTATVSVMPADLFKPLQLRDIADLFAYLETGKTMPETPANAGANAATGR